LTVSTVPGLHVPDEPTTRAQNWLAAVLDGRELADVLAGDGDGFTPWLWSRWRSLAAAGLNEDDLGLIVLSYRREIWLWLAGERTWVQCCSGLIGRIYRRLAGSDGAGV
jgi:cell wall-associated NlpC family hydrolase